MSDASRDRDRGGAGPEGPAPAKPHRPDVYVAGVVLALAALLFAVTFTFDRVPSSLAQNVQPAMFPRLVLIVIALIALVIPFEHHRKLRRGIDLDSERRDSLPAIVPATALVLVLLVATLPWLGALPALVLIAAILPVLWGERRWKILVPYVVLFPVAVLWLFSEVLLVTFPRGLVGDIFR